MDNAYHPDTRQTPTLKSPPSYLIRGISCCHNCHICVPLNLTGRDMACLVCLNFEVEHFRDNDYWPRKHTVKCASISESSSNGCPSCLVIKEALTKLEEEGMIRHAEVTLSVRRKDSTLEIQYQYNNAYRAYTPTIELYSLPGRLSFHRIVRN